MLDSLSGTPGGLGEWVEAATGRVALPWTVGPKIGEPGSDDAPILKACAARGRSTVRRGSRSLFAKQRLGRLGPGLPERANRQLVSLLQCGLCRFSDAGGRTGCNGTHPHQ